MSELANLDPQSAASMVMRHFPNDQEAVIQGLHGSRQLLFKYLQSSMDAALNHVCTQHPFQRQRTSEELDVECRRTFRCLPTPTSY